MKGLVAVGLTCLLAGALTHAQGTPAPRRGPAAREGAAATPARAKTRTAGGVVRTAWGDPDLQGVWDYWTYTPLERPKEYANKPTLTDAERAAQQKSLAGRAAAADGVDLPAGSVGGYSQEVWTERTRPVVLKQTSIIIDPEDGRIPPMTPAALARAKAEAAAGGHPVRSRSEADGDANPEDRGLSERCILGFSSGPPMLPGGYNNNVQIVQTKDYVVLHAEMVHDARIIPLDGRPHLPAGITTWLGDPRGHWEGDTLVVESTNFTGKVAAFSARRGASGYEFGAAERTTLIERFRRVDGKTLEYEFTVNDPATFTRPFTGRMPMTLSDGLIYEYACHEGNYGLVGILRGGRANDRPSTPAAPANR